MESSAAARAASGAYHAVAYTAIQTVAIARGAPRGITNVEIWHLIKIKFVDLMMVLINGLVYRTITDNL